MPRKHVDLDLLAEGCRNRKPWRDRFWEKVYPEPNTGYWLWGGALHPNTSYGSFSIKYTRFYAHRVAYELEVGPIPDGLVLDHLCRVRWCVRPDHLEAVTDAVNLHRGVSLTLAIHRSGACMRGHRRDEHGRQAPNGSWHCSQCRRDLYAATRPPKAVKTHCPRGHAYDLIDPYSGAQRCSTCRKKQGNERSKRYNAKMRAEKAA